MRLEVRSSNLILCKCTYFIKKLYLSSRGAPGGRWLAGIFFLVDFVYFVFFNFFISEKMICRGGS